MRAWRVSLTPWILIAGKSGVVECLGVPFWAVDGGMGGLSGKVCFYILVGDGGVVMVMSWWTAVDGSG